MRVLVTNDDGFDSPGLHALARVAIAAGHDVVIAAPDEEASGSSASITAHDAYAVTAAGGRGRIRVREEAIAGIAASAHRVYAAPALIALLAAHGSFGPAPEIVVSGINRGANVGHAILHSGTVGAALTGGLNDGRGLAVSLAVANAEEHPHWETAGAIVARVLPLIAAQPVGAVLNVNVPNVALAEAAGLELIEAPLARFGIVHTTVTEPDDGHIDLAIADPSARFDTGTDAALLAGGAATITSIRPVVEAERRVLSPDATPRGHTVKP